MHQRKCSPQPHPPSHPSPLVKGRESTTAAVHSLYTHTSTRTHLHTRSHYRRVMEGRGPVDVSTFSYNRYPRQLSDHAHASAPSHLCQQVPCHLIYLFIYLYVYSWDQYNYIKYKSLLYKLYLTLLCILYRVRCNLNR